MDSVKFIRKLFVQLHDQIVVVMNESSFEQFNWKPPGTMNPISTIFLHIINAEDFHIHTILQGRPRIWETAGWNEKIGLAAPPGRGRNWEEAKARQLLQNDLANYQSSVRKGTDEYLASLTNNKLNGKVSFVGGERQVAEVIASLIIHVASHTGEIAALKGIQGVKGLPL